MPRSPFPWPFLSMAFRPLFWLGALFSLLSIAMWALSFNGVVAFEPFGGIYFWHVHEMLFGFAVAIITGFLLTAVQNWTGVTSISGGALGCLVLVWLLARVFMAFPDGMSSRFIILIDLSYLPLAAYFFAKPIFKVRQWRNLFFVPILLVMALLNALMHLSLIGEISLSYISLSHIMILMVALVMVIMGGRVFPMFTANGTGTARVANIEWLDKLAVGLVLLSIIVELGGFPLPKLLSGSMFIAAGIVNLIRAIRWRIWVTLKTSLVWSLHLSYWAVCLGFILIGLTKFNDFLSVSMAFHTITVGGMGLMILSMISRVSLGHTGRPIKVGVLMGLAFLAIFLGFIVRVLLPIFISEYTVLIFISASFWVFAYSCFVVSYAAIIFKPRRDIGKL